MEDETPLGEEIDGGNDDICPDCGGWGLCFCGGLCNMLNTNELYELDELDDEMDGDAQSALASAGWGTDEDYEDYGDDDWSYD
jgi:hypothetical protein